MSEQVGITRFVWRDRHSKEARLRRAFGQTHSAIGEAFGCRRETVAAHIKRHDLDAPLGQQEQFRLIAEIEADKIIHDLLEVDAGSASQARLRTSFLALSKHLPEGQEMEELEMESSTPIKEMNDDELDMFLASLVSGLEGTGTEGVCKRCGNEVTARVSVSENGSPGPEAAGTAGNMA